MNLQTNDIRFDIKYGGRRPVCASLIMELRLTADRNFFFEEYAYPWHAPAEARRHAVLGGGWPSHSTRGYQRRHESDVSTTRSNNCCLFRRRLCDLCRLSVSLYVSLSFSEPDA